MHTKRSTSVGKMSSALVLVSSLAVMVMMSGVEAEVDHNPKSFLTLNNKEQQVVKGLDLKRYMGRWYEIAKFPSFYEPQSGENTRATYTLKPDGTVDVLNETFLKGKRIFIKGFAYKADPKSDEAKLKVKFNLLPVIGDYWVLYLDADYQYAVVGEPSRTSLFILTRTNKIDDLVYNQLVQKAAEQGYDVRKLRKTPQSNPPPS
uniref:Lipocalin/cytosolic fatty-acid binding domain-containing protein n=1 Tax=Kalanchoe fedtschenkoi TaxID=63787 RepID=A0A7N0UXK0_KALFE